MKPSLRNLQSYTSRIKVVTRIKPDTVIAYLPAFTKETLFMHLTGNLGSSLMKMFRASTKLLKTESWRKVNLPCDKEI